MTNSDQTEKGSQIQIVVLFFIIIIIIIAKQNINLKGGFSLHICHTWQLLNLSFCYSIFFLNTFLGAARQSNSRANVVYNFIRLFLNHPVLLYFRVISPTVSSLSRGWHIFVIANSKGRTKIRTQILLFCKNCQSI